MLFEWKEYSTVRYAEKLTVEKCAIPEIAKKSGKGSRNLIMERTTFRLLAYRGISVPWLGSYMILTLRKAKLYANYVKQK